MTWLLTLGIWILALVLSLPVLAVIVLFVGTGRLLRWIHDLPLLERARAWRMANAVHQRLCRIRLQTDFPTPGDFAGQVRAELAATHTELASSIRDALVACARSLYEAEGFCVDVRIPAVRSELDAAKYHDDASRLIRKLNDPDILTKFHTALVDMFRVFCDQLPPITRLELTPGEAYGLTVRLTETLSSVPLAVDNLIKACSSPVAVEHDLLSGLRDRLDDNRRKVSGVSNAAAYKGSPKLVAPSDYKGPPGAVVQAYLEGTPLRALFDIRVPFELPDAVRFEHQWIVAGSGHGKTQCLQYMIARDLPRVARGECSVIVIDSQGDLIRNIANLKLFAPGQPLHDKLVLIDPTDVEYPLALNLFDAGQVRFDRYSQLNRDRLQNSIVELYDFVLGSLLSAELTQKQSVIFRFITRLMLEIPGATIHTFRELMEPQGLEKYRPYVAQLEGTARSFFETEFNSKQFEDTKRQVLRRVWGVLENRTFERMFSQSRSKLHLFVEMNAGKVILISTAKDLLKETGTQVFGRFFIALIAQAAQERATLPENARVPCFVYIDEAAEYFDQNVAMILETARKQKISLCCANQYVGQLSSKLQESFTANTSVKIVGGVSDKDARAFSYMLRCTSEFILGQPKGHFAVSVRNLVPLAVSLHVPFGYLEGMQRMVGDEYTAVRNLMREKYAVSWHDVSDSSPVKCIQPLSANAELTAPGEW